MINPLTGEEIELDPITGQPIDTMSQMAPIMPQQVEAPIAPQPIEATPPDVKDYIMKKYNLGQYNDEGRAAAQADTNLDWGDKASAALMALGAGLQGRDSGAAAASRLNQLQGQRNKGLENFEKGRNAKIQEFGLDRDMTKFEREDRDDAEKQGKLLREKDPTSQESKMAQELAVAMGFKGDASKITAQQFQEFSPAMQKKYEIAQRSLDREEQRKMRESDLAFRRDDQKLRREEMDARRDEAKTVKASERMEKDVQKLSDKLGNAQELSNALQNVNSKLGFNLDEATVSDGKIMVKGKARDLPGISIPGYGRSSLLQDDAQQLESAMSKVFNTELKDRSGAAVTTPELERLKEEFGKGKYNTESQMVQALQDYKRMVNQELKNREAGFRPEVVNQYKERGGATSERFNKALTPQDKQALDWATANPDDPRAQQIRARLGM